MGIVYKARNLRLERLVALKVLRSGIGVAPEQEARFHREARAVARLRHPHIVQIYEIGEHEGLSYLALEYVGGGSLAQHLDPYLADIRTAVALVAKVARAVQHAHDSGILHRDLKPANILLDEQGEPRISDFGLARVANSSTEITLSGQVMGTPTYMPPEQAGGQTSGIGPASDVWALGVILYQLLTGQPPFRAGGVEELLRQILTERAPKLYDLRPGLEPELDWICGKCLAKDPHQRYPSAAALADDLDRYLGGKPITARPPSIWQRLTRFFSFRKSDTPRRGDPKPDS
jgi:serine/threonine protein kinase